MKLIEISENRKDVYNRFIMDNETGSFLQSWEWGDWQKELGHEVFRFLLVDSGQSVVGNNNDNDNVIASLQVVKTRLPLEKYYLYMPYGPVTDFRCKIEDLRFALAGLQSQFSDAVFIRVEPKCDNFNLKSFNLLKKTVHIQPTSTLVLDLIKPIGQLLNEMHPKTRYNIKLAQRHGVEVISDLVVVPGHGLYWSEAINLVMDTAKRQSFKTFPREYYQKLLDFFAIKNHQSDLKVYVYRALYQRELLAAAIMLDFGGTRTYLFGGSSLVHREVMAPQLLHFTAVGDAKNSGLKFYDFWGLDTLKEKNPGFARFKLGFGGSKLEYPGAFDYVLNKNQYKIYKVFRSLNRLRQRVRI